MKNNEFAVEIKIGTFGEVFSSRTEGREAGLATIAYHLDRKNLPSTLKFNFDGVLIMTPSWLSEYVQCLTKEGIKNFEFLSSKNLSVLSSVEFINEELTELQK